MIPKGLEKEMMPFLEAADVLGYKRNVAQQKYWRGAFPIKVIKVSGRLYCSRKSVKIFLKRILDELAQSDAEAEG